MNKSIRNTQALAAAIAITSAFGAHAAGYPERPITLVVPYPPGASTDSLARATAEALGKVLKQTVIVENRPGGATTIATMAVKRAEPDGYTLLFQTDGLVSGTYAVQNVGYQPADFTTISPLTRTPFALIAPSSIPSGSLDAFFRYARENPSKMNYGMLGSGLSVYKILGDAITSSTGITWTEIPYKGGMEGIQAAMAGQIQAYFATVSLAVAQQKQPTINIVAVTDTRRSPYLPDVPTFKEAGYPDVVSTSLFGLAVRSQTPKDIQETLAAAMRQVVSSDEMKKSMTTLALEPYEGSLQDYAREGDELAQRYAAAAKRLGMVAQ